MLLFLSQTAHLNFDQFGFFSVIWVHVVFASILTVDSEIFARILFSRIALKDTLVMWKIRD